MIKLNKISVGQVPPLVAIAYNNDNDLFDKYHVAPNLSYNDCVNATMIMIKNATQELGLSHYKVIYNKQPIGYISVANKNLFSFSINKQFRKKEILQSWWNEIVGVLGKYFICRLYPNNERAINWLKKCNMVQIDEGYENCISLAYNKVI